MTKIQRLQSEVDSSPWYTFIKRNELQEEIQWLYDVEGRLEGAKYDYRVLENKIKQLTNCTCCECRQEKIKPLQNKLKIINEIIEYCERELCDT